LLVANLIKGAAYNTAFTAIAVGMLGALLLPLVTRPPGRHMVESPAVANSAA
jgi:hypothetical protein